jgi:hypothetical protein
MLFQKILFQGIIKRPGIDIPGPKSTDYYEKKDESKTDIPSPDIVMNESRV